MAAALCSGAAHDVVLGGRGLVFEQSWLVFLVPCVVFTLGVLPSFSVPCTVLLYDALVFNLKLLQSADEGNLLKLLVSSF